MRKTIFAISLNVGCGPRGCHICQAVDSHEGPLADCGPYRWSFLARHGAYVLTGAMERAGSLEPDKIVAELEKTDYRGVTGRIRFDKTHQAILAITLKKLLCAFPTSGRGERWFPFTRPLLRKGKCCCLPG